MRVLVTCLFAFGVTAGSWWVWDGAAAPAPPPPDDPPAPVTTGAPPSALVQPIVLPDVVHEETHEGHAHPHPHGEQLCASGCAASRHPTPRLDAERFDALLAAFATEPMSEESPALEELLYHGRQVPALLDRRGEGVLDAEREAFLRAELERQTVTVEIRVVDEHGEVRAYFPPTRVPLDIRHVFDMEADGLPQPLETSGTVKRVGLKHFWQRL